MMAESAASAPANFLSIDLDHPDESAIARAAGFLEAGQAAIFPTDTVYGIGVAVRDVSNPDLLFSIKQRNRGKAIPWLVSGADDVERFGRNVRGYYLDMARELWPGPLTLVVEAGDAVPEAFRAGDSTIALRVPNSQVALALMRELSSPLATTSANMSGLEAVNDSAKLDPRICELVPVVLAGGLIEGGEPSTVVVCTKDRPEVARCGAVSEERVMGFV